jgi:cytochrome c-type biogenesis protein CcmH/NrfG
MNAPTDWVSAIVILASGLIVGMLFVYFFNRRKSAPKLGGEPDLELQDLEGKRDALVAQLREPGLGDTERRTLETQTADVLRQLDKYQRRPGAPVSSTPAPAAAAMNPAIKGFLWGACSVAALATLGYLVMQQAAPRTQDAPVTGGGPMAAQQQQQQQQQAPPDPAVQRLEAAVQADPSNIQLRNDLAQAYLERENLMGVFEQTKAVLEKAPDNSRALAYQGLVRLAMGDSGAAEQMLQRATQVDPKNLDGWVARAWLYAQQKKMDESEKMIAEAIRQSPPDRARLEGVFAQMKVAAQQQSQVASGQLPEGHPPIDGAGASPGGPMAQAPQAPTAQAGMARPAAPDDGRSINVTIALDPSAASKTGILYVIARNPLGGPPAAVKRMEGVTFPLTITLGSADSMMGQPLPDNFRLEARLDSDGDARTKPPTDPSAIQDGVTPGATVRLALK